MAAQHRVALFGGSFNPPHIGHQMAMLYALATARVERLVMVPCFRHPFDKALIPFEHRLEMCRLAAAPFGPHVEVSDVERRLGGESRTLLTVRALMAEDPTLRLVLVIGSDLVGERERWYGWPELSRLVEFAIVPRDGHAGAGTGAVGAELAIPDVSSTGLRARLGRGEPIAGLVAAGVADYIAAHGLYGHHGQHGGQHRGTP